LYPSINVLKEALREGPQKLASFNPREPRKRSHFYVRDASECPVAVWLDCQGIPKPVMPSRVLALQRRGNDLEAQVLDSLRAYYPDTKIHIPTLKVQFSTVFTDGSGEPQIDQFFVAGRPDALLYNNILEVKSVGVEVYDTYRSEANLPQRFRDQLLLYGTMFGLPSLVVILVCRDDHRHRVYSVAPDPDRVLFLLARLGSIYRALIDGVPPERDAYEQCPIYCPCWSIHAKEASVGNSTDPSSSLPSAGEAAGRDHGTDNEVGALCSDRDSAVETPLQSGLSQIPDSYSSPSLTGERA